ncbi:hypothetical protein [Fimbriiglobus ruber]|uniref:Uncharacterized protein n=1 Tax=Fimbriiglobus ruber TaxID=1908690 RepID=A0A225DHX2_9BACT|nr:hypothetical protein [Fimbriiglobus ruber]OWK35965.1 hypothetical protein FRUB_08528 [Fimbriiglobus ruber]
MSLSPQTLSPNPSSCGAVGSAAAFACDANRRSIYVDCEDEFARFKWLESEKAGHDVGELAIYRWLKMHWWGYLRARWLEHLQGKCFWIELDRGDFGLLLRAFQEEKDLLDAIVGHLKDGRENLDVIRWAKANQISIEPVIRILEALDINSRRLVHEIELRGSHC